MSCQICNGDCVGIKESTKQHLDITICYRSSDCQIDNSGSPWWVVVNLDSTRGSRLGGTGGVDVKGELTTGKNSEIDVLNDVDKTYVPNNSQGIALEFRIEQVVNRSPSKMEDLELELEMKESSSYDDIDQFRFQRRLSRNP